MNSVCWAGAAKASWTDQAGTVQPELAGEGRHCREFFLAWHGQLHTFAAVSVFTFERGEELENAVMSLIYILCIDSIVKSLAPWFAEAWLFCVYVPSMSLWTMLYQVKEFKLLFIEFIW